MRKRTRSNSSAAASPPPLLQGPYTAPPCRKGDWLNDELLGLVEVFGWTEGPLPWPRIRQKGPACPVLTDELARAVRTESEIAVAHWWGVSVAQVQRWRRELGVGRYTAGTRHQLRENWLALPPEIRAQQLAAFQSPQARANKDKAMARRRGQPAHPAARAALLRSNAFMLAGKTKKRSGNV